MYEAEQPELPPRVLELPDGLNAGSILFDRNGDRAILYTTSTNTARFAIWDTATDFVEVEELIKPVRAIALTPEGNGLLVLHSQQDLPDTPPTDDFYQSWALTLMSFEDRPFRENSIKLPAEPIGFANAEDGLNGYFIMEGVPSLVQLSYRSLLYEDIRLKSNPVYVGVLPDLDPDDGLRPPAWASQEHDLGRITFYQPDGGSDGEGSTETITGFELNNRIED